MRAFDKATFYFKLMFKIMSITKIDHGFEGLNQMNIFKTKL